MEQPGQATNAAALLVSHKMYMDYVGLVSQGFSVEPEHFYDMWIGRFINCSKANEEFNEGIWKYFIHKLVEDRVKRNP